MVAQELGIATDPDTLADPAMRQRIAARLAELAVDQITAAASDDLGRNVELTEPLERSTRPDAITFSGGVSEYIFETEDRDFDDIARMLAMEVRRQLKERNSLPVIDPGNRIRATVIGASQFTVQVSGKTIYLSRPGVLPVHNVPVVHIPLLPRADADDTSAFDPDAIAAAIVAKAEQHDIPRGGRMAIALTFHGEPEYRRLKALAQGLLKGAAPGGIRNDLLLVMIDGDVGRTVGNLLHSELGLRGELVSIDGVQLQDLDYVDVGELMQPAGVVPVVIKSLLFS
jgi:ethanolamine utilization protein EutA